VVASGARYKGLPLDRWKDFEGAGIFYARHQTWRRGGAPAARSPWSAEETPRARLRFTWRSEAYADARRPADELARGMSSYLAERIKADPRITVRIGNQITALHGYDFSGP
jgi:thioredoxin reductase (NADPH)